MNRTRPSKRTIRNTLLLTPLLLFLFILRSNLAIEANASGLTFNSVDDIQKNKVGLVLGTSKYLRDGRTNLFFLYRVQAAVELYNQGKIDYILVSGDNRHVSYNEPKEFRKELIKRGVPKEKIYLDYAGFRTLDSMVRAKEVFGLEEVTVISQQFHNERAIYIAKKNGLEAIGFNAQDVQGYSGFKVKTREALARTKVFLDLFMNVQPKFLGERIAIGE
jgi:SanA protein